MRLKYDDTHSDQKFSGSLLYPLSAWVFINAVSRRFHAMRRRLVGVTWAFPRNEGGQFAFREFLVRMGAIVFETHCIIQVF